jgi:glutaredoxin
MLVTAGDCRFCEQAHKVLEQLGVEPRELDVAGDEARLLAEQGVPLCFLPVLTDGTRAIAYGRFSERRLRKELAL